MIKMVSFSCAFSVIGQLLVSMGDARFLISQSIYTTGTVCVIEANALNTSS